MILTDRHWWMRLLLVCALGGTILVSVGASAQRSGPRRLVVRTAPVYPELARSMALQGTVKVEAAVAPDGSVKDVAIKGGHPVLRKLLSIQSAGGSGNRQPTSLGEWGSLSSLPNRVPSGFL